MRTSWNGGSRTWNLWSRRIIIIHQWLCIQSETKFLNSAQLKDRSFVMKLQIMSERSMKPDLLPVGWTYFLQEWLKKVKVFILIAIIRMAVRAWILCRLVLFTMYLWIKWGDWLTKWLRQKQRTESVIHFLQYWILLDIIMLLLDIRRKARQDRINAL